jgi:hypothetical protein
MILTSLQPLPEKLQLQDEKNLLIQGLPSSVEKQFSKLFFAKNVTPLLKIKKIDFALVFAISQKQLSDILKDVIPALQTDAKLWVAYPKVTSKIVSDLCRDNNWEFIAHYGLECVRQVALDNVWTAIRFKKPEAIQKKANSFSAAHPASGIDYKNRTVEIPADLHLALKESREAFKFFENLSFTNKREYVEWIITAKKEETKVKRLVSIIEKLKTGKRNPSEK